MFKKMKTSPFGGISELKQIAIEQNIKRISYAACILIVFEIKILFDPSFSENIFLQIGYFLITVIGLFYTIFTLVNYKNIVANPKKARNVFISYWILTACLGMTPFFISDIQKGMPVNVGIMLVLLCVIPMYVKSDIIPVVLGYTVFNVIIAVSFEAGINYIVDVVSLAAIGIVLAYLVQQRYIDMIVKFKLETRIDPLTGVLNRRGGLDKMQTVIELSKRHGMAVAVYMVDIDFFKEFNDKYGHIKGDQVLKEITEEICKVFARSADVVCRFGGEEFVVCISTPSIKDADLMAKRLRRSIEHLAIVSPRSEVSDFLTVSVGYTVYKPSGYADYDTIDEIALIAEADAAMYAAKNSGRNTVYSFDSKSDNNDVVEISIG